MVSHSWTIKVAFATEYQKGFIKISDPHLAIANGGVESFLSRYPVLKLRLHNRFIHVGVDISSYALLIGGRNSYPPLSWLSYSTHVLVYKWSVYLYKWYIGLLSARPSAVWDENNKVNVCTPFIPAGLKCPPLSKTISLITRLKVN